jgi:hypothetical protein
MPRLPSPRPLSRERERGEFARASAGVVRVMLKPRTGRASGPCRGLPLFQRRVHPLREGPRIGEWTGPYSAGYSRYFSRTRFHSAFSASQRR